MWPNGRHVDLRHCIERLQYNLAARKIVRVRQLESVINRNASVWRGQQFYVGRSNYRDASRGRPRQGQKNWSRRPERSRDLRGTAAGGSARIDTTVVLYPLQDLPHVPFRKRPQGLRPDVAQGASRQQ